eukprot:COSAG02_NODE_45098_length_360_cov_0.785441_1_plen_92_part_01
MCRAMFMRCIWDVQGDVHAMYSNIWDVQGDVHAMYMGCADGTTSHRVEWRTQLFRPGHGDESKDWGADVVLSSEQTITPSGDVKLITRLNAL